MNAGNASGGSDVDLGGRIGQTLVSASSDAIVAADKDGQIVFWNPGAERIFGLRAPDAPGRSLDIIIDVTGRFEDMRALKRALACRDPVGPK
jgi:PAS domain S-box-containing protein